LRHRPGRLCRLLAELPAKAATAQKLSLSVYSFASIQNIGKMAHIAELTEKMAEVMILCQNADK
jgi:hypothetical protein